MREGGREGGRGREREGGRENIRRGHDRRDETETKCLGILTRAMDVPSVIPSMMTSLLYLSTTSSILQEIIWRRGQSKRTLLSCVLFKTPSFSEVVGELHGRVQHNIHGMYTYMYLVHS